ncbi:MAG: sensor histidine kinase [Mucilaginibacter sp.]
MKHRHQRAAGFTDILEAAVEERTRSLQLIVKTLETAKEEVSLSLAKEKEISQLKSHFVSLASHEFRTPLSSILLSASLIEQYYDRLNKQKILGYVSRIKNAVNDLNGVLNDFLSIERIESGKVEAVFKKFELNDLCRSIISEMQALVKPGQDIYLESSSSEIMVCLDPNLLRHCLVNLLSNAIKYSPENSNIGICILKTTDECQLSVTDHGIGIPTNQQHRLFEAFFRADNVIDISGTGLGLNIVKRYADLMNIQIKYNSAEHSGTTFTLVFKQGDAC